MNDIDHAINNGFIICAVISALLFYTLGPSSDR